MALTESKSGWFVVSGRERFDEINRMRDPDRWPWETYLPVKRTSKTGAEFGVIHAIEGDIELAVPSEVRPIVYDNSGNVKQEFATFDELLDAGWRAG